MLRLLACRLSANRNLAHTSRYCSFTGGQGIPNSSSRSELRIVSISPFSCDSLWFSTSLTNPCLIFQRFSSSEPSLADGLTFFHAANRTPAIVTVLAAIPPIASSGSRA